MIDQIKRQIDMEPFRPFAIETGGGTWVTVGEREAIGVSPYAPHLIVVFDQDGTFYTIDPEQVSAIQNR